MNPAICQLLINGLEKLKLSINNEQLSQFSDYLDILSINNEQSNLTAIKDEGEIVIKHFLDSAVILTTRDIPREAKVVDIGAGAGFPGLPLKILRPDLKITLIESSRKKAEFLRRAASGLGLGDIEILNARAEDIANNNEFRETFALAVSRAVAEIVVLTEYSLPMVKVGGHAVFYKAKTAKTEVEEAKYAIELLGGRIEEIAEVVVPFLNAERYLVSIEKVTSSPQKYPRKAGMPAKRPLRVK